MIMCNTYNYCLILLGNFTILNWRRRPGFFRENRPHLKHQKSEFYKTNNTQNSRKTALRCDNIIKRFDQKQFYLAFDVPPVVGLATKSGGGIDGIGKSCSENRSEGGTNNAADIKTVNLGTFFYVLSIVMARIGI